MKSQIFPQGSMAEQKRKLIKIAAQMAQGQGMPDQTDWPGWNRRVPQKLWVAARNACDKAYEQCRLWAISTREVFDALPNTDANTERDRCLEIVRRANAEGLISTDAALEIERRIREGK